MVPNITNVAPPSNRFRDMLHKTAYRREQAEHNQHQRDDKSHIATGDAGQLNYAVVLTETGIRERIKYR
ncbi:Uncharacterised protein [Salmonella enterica subsp. enterica]|uniref:Uncharacterized protein n=1 Tax=Salmonella enterica I TaxID=59201 RepID=A0A379WJE5_SALET|nr:Uncharacterised protein [Salmonella enterica subsp. enterica]